MHALMPAKGFFVIIFEGRTGSSYTITALNKHPGILCYPEIMANFDHEQQKAMWEALTRGESIATINPYAEYHLYNWGTRIQKGNFVVVGFKTKIQDVCSVSVFYDLIQKHQFKLIYLKRQNLLKAAVSWINARRLNEQVQGHWNATNKMQVQGPLHVDLDELIVELRRRIRFERWHVDFFEAYDGDKRIFYYEDLLANEKDFFVNMQDFLGVGRRSLKGHFVKNTPDQLRDAVVNYTEVRDLCVGTYFERFLHE